MPTYRDEVLADNPVRYYRLNETSGTVANDASTSGQNGTYVNAPTLGYESAVADDTAGVFLTRAESEMVTMPNTGLPAGGSAYTLEAWIKPALFDEKMGIVSVGNFGSTRQANAFRVAAGGALVNYWWAADLTTATGVIAINTWHHVVATFDGTTRRIYVDGVQKASDTPGAPAVVQTTATIGRTSPSLAEYWQGGIDEVAIYNTGLSAARVLAHYNARNTQPFGAFGSGASDAQVSAAVVIAAVVAPASTGSSSSDATTTLPSMVNSAVTDNRTGGRWRNGSGTAQWTPAVVIPPVLVGGARDAAIAFTQPVVDDATGRVTYNAAKVEATRHLDRILVGNKDVTHWRGVTTPLPSWTYVEPLGYGPGTMTFPQVHASFEKPGFGSLRFLRLGSPVIVERVDLDTEEVVARDYKGVILSHDHSGAMFTVQVGGEASGRAALREKQVPIFFWNTDLGRMAYDAVRTLGLRFEPYLGPVTGIRMQRWGGTGHLDFIQQICRAAWTRAGNQWVVMPDDDGVYRMTRKDTTTIHGTVYLDDERAVGSLVRDLSEEPNRIYMTGVTPEGLRVRFGAYPGLKYTEPPPYPFNDNRTFSEGTTDASTDTGDGISVMVNRLFITKYLDRIDLPGGYDADVTKAIKDLQKDGGLTRTGNMNLKTWRVLYDLNSTGYSLRGSRILPAAQRDKVKPWNLSPSGSKISRNPDYDRSVLPVDRNVDAGTGFERAQLREWARAELEQAREDNYVGTIVFKTNALVRGEHNPGDPLTVADLMPARDLRAGMNLWLPLFAGGQIVHVSAVNVSTDGEVSADVDTRARDAMEVWEVMARNRESRRSLRRAWIQENRQSQQRKDSTGVWDEVGGVLGDKVKIEGNRWVVFPVVAGQSGTIRSLRVNTNPNAEYVMAVFGKRIRPRRLRRLVGNPLTRAGSKKWEKESVRRTLDEDWLLYIAGSNAQPLGYFPKTKTKKADDDVSAAPLTGRWEDDAGFPYFASPTQVLWVAIWADRDTSIPRGRIMWPTLESGT